MYLLERGWFYKPGKGFGQIFQYIRSCLCFKSVLQLTLVAKAAPIVQVYVQGNSTFIIQRKSVDAYVTMKIYHRVNKY